MLTKKIKTVSEYIKTAPKETQKKLQEIQATIRKAAPKAKEEIKWGMPAYSYKRILVIFGAFKNHIGFYPTPNAIKKFSKEITRFKYAKGSIQFPLSKPLPLSLIRKMTLFRVKESKEEDKKWKSK